MAVTMAEIEMEVDIAPQYGTGARLDDDLIDYDTEAEKELSYENNPELTYDELPYAYENATAGQQTHDDVEYFQEQEDEPRETVDAQIEGDALEQASPVHESSHEIDYDIEDVSNMPTADDPSETQGLVTGDQDLDDVSPAEVTLEAGEVGGQTEDQAEDQAEDQEISWEHEQHEHEHDGPEKKLESIIEEDDLLAATNDQVVPNRTAVSPVPETKKQELDIDLDQEHEHDKPLDFAEESGYAHNSSHDEGADEGLGEYETVEDDANDREESDADSQYPAITVQYKGDEYPCFSANSDGFFSQLSLLDESIKSVLEAFREELTNELLAEDELVFQVDELGLEFSEVSVLNHGDE